MVADKNKKSLIIVESPTKANTIKKYLPSNFQVVASKGHVVDLNPNPSNKDGVYGVDVNDDFKLDYVIVDGKEALLSDMKKLLKKSEQLILASDEDREGESIAWHLLNQLKPTVPVYRMVFHEITKKAILAAFDNCREIDINLVRAQEARRTVDRLQGYGISPLLSQKLGAKYSAGRVQSPALKMIVEKERVRRAFKASDYYSVESVMSVSSSFSSTLTAISGVKVAASSSYDKETGELKKDVRVLSESDADRITNDIIGKEAEVESVMHQDKIERPQMPFTTSTLQQDATRKLHKGAREIMMIAQHLYENGFITYMRTDSPNLSDECIKASRESVMSLFGKEYLSPSPRNFKAKTLGAQEAHEAIRPSGDVMRSPKDTGLSGDELKLYTLIWQRTLSTQMKECEKAITTVTMKCDEYTFTSSGTVITFKGFRALYEAATDESDNKENMLPSLSAGDKVAIESAEAKAHVTAPPARYNEATLVKTLESEEIGRPSTYATIISTLIDRHYIVREGQYLVPTFTGFFVDAFLEKAFSLYIGYDFTKNMEAGLDKIAAGAEDKSEYLSSFWFGSASFKGLEHDLKDARATTVAGEVKNLTLPGLSYSFREDDLDVHYEIRTGKFGPYLSSDYTDTDSGKVRMASIDEKKYFPGTFTDEDARSILFPEEVKAVLYDKYELKSGRYGDYFTRIADGKIASWPKIKAEAINASEEFIDLLFELPKSMYRDEDGEEVVLKSGPYGFYASYKGKNTRVADPLSFNAESVIADEELPTFTLDGKSAEIAKGRYGYYVKYDGRNVPLPSAFRKDISSLKEDDVAKAVNGVKEEKSIDAEKTFQVDGETVSLINGRYGYYLKRGKDNIALSDEIKKDISLLTDDKAAEIVRAYVPKAKKSFSRRK